MNVDDLLRAVMVLAGLEFPARAREAAAQLPAHVDATVLHRAADGAQQLARAVVRLQAPTSPLDEHDVRSLYR